MQLFFEFLKIAFFRLSHVCTLKLLDSIFSVIIKQEGTANYLCVSWDCDATVFRAILKTCSLICRVCKAVPNSANGHIYNLNHIKSMGLITSVKLHVHNGFQDQAIIFHKAHQVSVMYGQKGWQEFTVNNHRSACLPQLEFPPKKLNFV